MGMSSLVTGLTGLAANQAKLDVVGNNIANVNTVGFKASRLDFKTQFSQTFSEGTPSDANFGGTNPLQVGMGTQEGAVTRNFNDGSREVTGVNTHLAMEGNGWFILQDQQGQVYTRDGSFKLNSENKLVNADGKRVEGFGVDSNFQPIPGVLTDIVIPVGGLTIAQATSNLSFDGNLNAGGVPATSISQLGLDQPLYLLSGGTIDPTNPPTAGTALTSLANSSGTPVFQAGDQITIQGVKGNRSLAPQTFTIGSSGTTLGDLLTFMQGALGINMSAGVNQIPAGTQPPDPGVTLGTSPAGANAASIQIAGNLGAQNDITMAPSAITVTRAGATSTPFTFSKTSSATGESVFTSSTVYDSLGNPISVNLTAVLTDASSSGTSWRFFAETPDDTTGAPGIQTAVGTGMLTFNNFGQLTSTSNANVVINRSGTGSNSNLNFAMNFARVTSLSGGQSEIAATLQDGSAKGTLSNFAIGTDGTITGTFTNGLTRTLGQVAVATFRNNAGLVDRGDNTFATGPNSGSAIISAPTQFSAGRVISGALELANVDLSSEFVSLISASTGFSAASRVITTSNQLLQELLNSAR